MAKRPIFLPRLDDRYLVYERYVEFTWSPGMAASQKRKSIADLHKMARKSLNVRRPLEVSSKSEDPVGVALSSFNLSFRTEKGLVLCVECAFQGSKVFEGGGPYRDLYFSKPVDAKRDQRLRTSGEVVGFSFFGQLWPSRPLTAFYDWLYINALMKNEELADVALTYDAYTDIEFNPDRSINCQARSVALYQALFRLGQLHEALASPDAFRSLYRRQISAAEFHGDQRPLD